MSTFWMKNTDNYFIYIILFNSFQQSYKIEFSQWKHCMKAIPLKGMIWIHTASKYPQNCLQVIYPFCDSVCS